jgi:hypothetical protein
MSVSDIRLSVGFPTHPKTKKLRKLLGNDAVLALVYLFIFAAQNKPDGDLSGMYTEDIEIAVDWEGEEGAFVAALLKVGFLNGDEGTYVIHDWEDHNGWVYGFNDRSERGKWANLVRHHGREYAERQMPEYADRLKKQPVSKEEQGVIQEPDTSIQESPSRSPNPPTRSPNSESRSPPSPSPSPSPSLKSQPLFVSVPLTASDAAEKIESGSSPPETLPSLHVKKPPPPGFAEFWSAYPRKVGKGAAEKLWGKLKPDLPIVLKAIERARVTEQWQRDGGQFIPHPATWLSQRRWEDELEAKPTRGWSNDPVFAGAI